MKKAILYFLISYVVLTIIAVFLAYFEILPEKIIKSFNIAICIAGTYLAANAFAKSCERVPAIKERLIFALFAVIISEIIGFVVLVFTALFAFDIFHSLELWTLLFLALILLIKFLGIFYFFGFFGKIIFKSTKNNLN